MSDFTAAGTLLASGSTGNQSVTGLGFQPAAVFFVWNPSVAGDISENAFKNDMYLGCGAFADDGAIQNWSQYIYGEDSATIANWASNTSPTACITSFAEGEAEGVSLDADGFTINWLTAATTDMPVYWFAYNSDHFLAAVGTMTLPATGSVTVSGISFAPSAIVVGAADTAGNFGIGISDQQLDQDAPAGTVQTQSGGSGWWEFGGAGADFFRGINDSFGGVYGNIAVRTTTTIIAPTDNSWSRTAWNSDGFEITANGSFTPRTSLSGYLALRLVSSVNDRSEIRNTGSTTAVVATPLILPKCGLFITATGTFGGGDWGITIGFADDQLNQRSCWTGGINASAPSVTFCRANPGAAIQLNEWSGTTPVQTSEATITAWDKESFDVNETVGSSNYVVLLHGLARKFQGQIYRLVKR